jgi:hypothetical protein
LENDDEEILANSDCIRTIRNGKPKKIEFYYYSGLNIDWSGISFIAEHGSGRTLIKFNKFFKLS